MINAEDNRSKNVVLTPFCLLAQAFQAKGIVRYEWKSAIYPIVDLLLKNHINIIQMPCAEYHFKGLNREPMGYSKYNTPEFRKVCKKLVGETFEMIKNIIANNYNILAILGIEMSSSCAVNYQYSNKGMVHVKGVFIDELDKKLKENNIEIPMIGVNRKHIKKSYKQLEKILVI